MAKIISKKTAIIDLKDEDFFEKFNLKTETVLGKGMSGEVILVTPTNNPESKLAVKKFSLTEEASHRRLREFTREARIMQTVSHPHLVPCVRAGRCRDYAAIAMPYYPYGDLLELEGKQESRHVTRYMSQVASAVDQLHRHNIVHNDIKLENVFMDASDCVHLGDLGLALLLKGGCETAVAGRVCGTKAYWPPEREAADRFDEIDPFKCDIYAIGVMFWLLVSGELPAEGANYRARFETASDLELLPRERMALRRLLEPNPKQRPTASEAVEMLK